jgi:hypothetical protein
VLRGGFEPHTSGRLVQECGKGLVDIKIDGERLLLALPSRASVSQQPQISPQ